jgi:hypothetical protein
MSQSTFLFAMPSFWDGMSRSVDIGDTMTEFNSSLTPVQADSLAIWNDWRMVGGAILDAMNQFVAEHPEMISREQKKQARKTTR